MGTTPGGIPYPEGSDTPDVSYWLQQQAEAIDTALRPKIQTGTVAVSITGAVQGLLNVTFDTPFPAAPVVVGNVVIGGTSPALLVYVTNITANGFTINLVNAGGASGTWTRTVNWVAVLPL